jgi:glycosyltransferase involved in cell wall biosynthesis
MLASMNLGYLYVTADAIGVPTGGGTVTLHESMALASTCSGADYMRVWQFPDEARPWGADLVASSKLIDDFPDYRPRRAHFYSGTFTKAIEILKARGTIVSYTCAAHDIAVSQREHERLGLAFDYPHLTNPALWRAYVRGYQLADVVICPSQKAADIARGYGCARVEVIPHGFTPPTHIAPIPARFVVGYLGQPGPDKGLSYLIDAWQRWNDLGQHPDALLAIAGRGTEHLLPLIRKHNAGSYHVLGEVNESRDLYDACCVYVQPSATEGFGCEVLEARAHGRPVVCSNGAGARDFASQVVLACDASAIACAIDSWHDVWCADPQALIARADASAIGSLTWAHIRARYVELFS